MKHERKRIILFLGVGGVVLFLQAILYQVIVNIIGEYDTWFGLPFSSSMFLFGFLMLVFVVIMYLLFPRTKRKIDNHSTL